MHLRGIHALNMGNCSQTTITDAAFAHLRGIQKLDKSECNQLSRMRPSFSCEGAAFSIQEAAAGIAAAAFLLLNSA